jgi:hypothetical protein
LVARALGSLYRYWVVAGGCFPRGAVVSSAVEQLVIARAILGGERDPFAQVWEYMPVDLRARILAASGYGWLGAHGHWHDVPAQYRGEVKRRCEALRDTLLRVFPLEDESAVAVL